MISKVKAVNPKNETYQSPNGLLYKFNYEMEDGAKLVANHKTEQCPFGVGDEVDYHIKGSNSYGSWGTVKKPEGNFSPQGTKVAPTNNRNGDTQDQIMRQSSLNRAVDALGQNKEPMQYTGLAEYFFNYVKTGEVKAKEEEDGKEEVDDLPF
jgi:hypothetical protein